MHFMNDCGLSKSPEMHPWSRLSKLMLEGCRRGPGKYSGNYPGKYSGKRQCSSRREHLLYSSQRWSVISILLENFEKTKSYLELTWVDKVRETKQWEYFSRPGIPGEEKAHVIFTILFCAVLSYLIKKRQQS